MGWLLLLPTTAFASDNDEEKAECCQEGSDAQRQADNHGRVYPSQRSFHRTVVETHLAKPWTWIDHCHLGYCPLPVSKDSSNMAFDRPVTGIPVITLDVPDTTTVELTILTPARADEDVVLLPEKELAREGVVAADNDKDEEVTAALPADTGDTNVDSSSPDTDVDLTELGPIVVNQVLDHDVDDAVEVDVTVLDVTASFVDVVVSESEHPPLSTH